ncbi:unnamed protein product [Sphagnum troendelagicum]|uniref:Uncharacterized protein n=1 Tax=Sphagnum troendelagicum TaxID=128251 RepID=A0ABP0TPS8_9BRYO
MWRNLQVLKDFKDNLTQIASDVLDTQDELATQSQEDSDGEQNGPRRHSSDYNNEGADLKAEVEWYKSEVKRLQAAESDIQAMSMNYVALLKEREGEVVRLREENDNFKNQLVMLAAHENPVENGESDRQIESQKIQVCFFDDTTRFLNHYLTSHKHLGLGVRSQEQVVALQDTFRKRFESLSIQYRREIESLQHDQIEASVDKSSEVASNGTAPQWVHEAQLQELELKIKEWQEKEQVFTFGNAGYSDIRELEKQVAEKEQACNKLKDAQGMALAESERLKELLEKERTILADTKLQLQIDMYPDLVSFFAFQLSLELQQVQQNMDEQALLSKAVVEHLQKSVTKLEEEKFEMQVEMEELQKSLQAKQMESDKPKLTNGECDSQTHMTEEIKAAEEACSMHRAEFEHKLEEVSLERDKALRDLSRLKQSLLDMDMSNSEKMDQDREQIAELKVRTEVSESLVVQLQQALNQAQTELAEVTKSSADGLQQSSKEILVLKQKLASCITALDSKDIELSNLQSALGQYYAESEAQERLFGELTAAKEEISKLSEDLSIANKAIEMKNKEINEAVEKLKMAELRKQEWEQNSRKLEEDVPRLRQALEQSITRLNRMSSDSDFYVDRRIVIKLLVTYFQRQHSREVLDLMVRMLGFTEEDKQRVGLAQQTATKGGVVRGVFSLPGRFVGGLLGSGGDASPRAAPSDNQSFADLWIDFLLKESEEREKRERREKAEADAKTGIAVEAMSRSSSSRLLSETEPGIAPLATYNGLPPKHTVEDMCQSVSCWYLVAFITL